MGDRFVYRICKFLEYPERDSIEPRYELVSLAELDRGEYEALGEAFDRIMKTNHSPLLEMLQEISADYRVQHALANVGATMLSRERTEAICRQARVSLFAAANAVYTYDEHATGRANRLGGTVPETVRAAFSQEYDSNWLYFFSRKLRNILTHASFEAFSAHMTNKLNAIGKPITKIEITVDRNAVIDDVGPTVRAILTEQSADPVVFDIIEGALSGVAAVQRSIQWSLYPQRLADLALVEPYREFFLKPHPAILARIPPDPQRMQINFSTVSLEDLHAAGMV